MVCRPDFSSSDSTYNDRIIDTRLNDQFHGQRTNQFEVQTVKITKPTDASSQHKMIYYEIN